ncbi:MAG: tyrosine-type recombinase/integrase [Methanolobus sp.]|uniref:tyrosine-type recombinase/integrase n=1 Tax=Methanolobus sp. TaxID=1874737 RepID=UPI002730A901|nr:tyrosine-type recombinase/integrase [Methanolobus sp.]MDP2216731.1 tyrosine-type recombinase/integrase [Methanolobus sp.]
MRVSDLKVDPTITEWFEINNSRPKTIKLYLLGMQHYTEYINMTPVELIEEAEVDIETGMLPKKRRIKKHMVGFRKHLHDSGLSPMSVHGYIAAVRSFYTAHEIELPHMSREGAGYRPKKENLRLPTIENLRHTQKMCSVLEEALLLCGISSGMGAAELAEIPLSVFEEGYDPETEVTVLDMRRGKVGFDFVTFLSPEASRAVLRYIDYRNRAPKNVWHVKKFEKRKTTPGSYLFITQKVRAEYLQTPDEKARKMTSESIQKVYRVLSNRAGLDTADGIYNIIRSHNMRKLFSSRLKNAGCDSDLVEYFMGHTIGRTKGAYYQPDIPKLKEIYIKFVPHLIVSEEFELKEELKKRDDEIDRYDSVMADMQRQIDDLRKGMPWAMELGHRIEPVDE